MTTECEALEAAIMAAPNDDAPRLIYADWVSEHGDYEFEALLRNEHAKSLVKMWAVMRPPSLLRDHLKEWIATLNLTFLILSKDDGDVRFAPLGYCAMGRTLRRR